MVVPQEVQEDLEDLADPCHLSIHRYRCNPWVLVGPLNRANPVAHRYPSNQFDQAVLHILWDLPVLQDLVSLFPPFHPDRLSFQSSRYHLDVLSNLFDLCHLSDLSVHRVQLFRVNQQLPEFPVIHFHQPSLIILLHPVIPEDQVDLLLLVVLVDLVNPVVQRRPYLLVNLYSLVFPLDPLDPVQNNVLYISLNSFVVYDVITKTNRSPLCTGQTFFPR